MNTDASLLRLALRGNATFSTLSGVTFLAASGVIAAFLGDVPAAEVMSVGGSLLLFAVALVWLASRPEIPPALVTAVIVADLAWVVATVFVVFAGVFTREGAIAAVMVANVVLAFAVLQWVGLRRTRALA